MRNLTFIPKSNGHAHLGHQCPPLLLSLCCGLLLGAFTSPADAAERDVAELRFDRRFANAPGAEAPVLPAWIAGVDQQDGTFYDEPASWQVADTVPDGRGRLTMYLDRSKLTTDLAATFLFSAEQATDFAVQLFDAQGRVVVVDLFGNLVEVSAAFATNTFIIPLTKYPTATKIVIRHVHGPLAIYGAVLYPVATEGPMVDAEVTKLARQLGDPLSPENPILKNLRNITAAPVRTSASTIASVVKTTTTAKTKTPATKALSTSSTMGCGPTTAGMMGCMCGVRRSTKGGPPILLEAPELPPVKPFKRTLAILVEDSHGGSDIFNEYNFGSAQLARVLTAQGARVESTLQARGFQPDKGLTREFLDQYAIIIFNGRFNGRKQPFSESEITAVSEWVKAGGGLLVTCSSPAASDHLDGYLFNPLVKPFGLEFGWENLEGMCQPAGAHPIVGGLPGFTVHHGAAVTGSSKAAADVARFQNNSAMMALQHSKGRVVAFGGGSAMQNQSLNSRIINSSSGEIVAANTNLVMNLALWLANSDAVTMR